MNIKQIIQERIEDFSKKEELALKDKNAYLENYYSGRVHEGEAILAFIEILEMEHTVTSEATETTTKQD